MKATHLPTRGLLTCIAARGESWLMRTGRMSAHRKLTLSFCPEKFNQAWRQASTGKGHRQLMRTTASSDLYSSEAMCSEEVHETDCTSPSSGNVLFLVFSSLLLFCHDVYTSSRTVTCSLQQETKACWTEYKFQPERRLLDGIVCCECPRHI